MRLLYNSTNRDTVIAMSTMDDSARPSEKTHLPYEVSSIRADMRLAHEKVGLEGGERAIVHPGFLA